MRRRGIDHFAFTSNGGSLGRTGRNARFTFDTVGLPLWLVALAAIAPPVIRIRRRQRLARAARLGLCRHCRYDLRATPGRCPECGEGAAPDRESEAPAEPTPVERAA